MIDMSKAVKVDESLIELFFEMTEKLIREYKAGNAHYLDISSRMRFEMFLNTMEYLTSETLEATYDPILETFHSYAIHKALDPVEHHLSPMGLSHLVDAKVS